MEEAFDPYQRWLGIPPAEQPPTYYRLLGIKPGERDPQQIDRAFQLRMDHVEACDDGTHPDVAVRLREHLLGARQVLLHPQSKAQYDAMLLPQITAPPGSGPAAGLIAEAEERRAGTGPQPAAPVADFYEVQAASKVDHGDYVLLPQPLAQATTSAGASATRRFWVSWVISVATVIVVALPVVALIAQRADPDSSPADGRAAATAGELLPSSHSPPSPSVPSPSSSFARPSALGPDSSPPSDRAPRPRGPQTLADLMALADDAPADQGTVTGLLDAARLAMSGRDLLTAEEHVRAAAAAARSPTECESARRIETLYRALAAFWRAVHDEAARLEGGEELPVGDAVVMIVEAGGGELVVRALGENYRYAVEDLPRRLALALALRRLPRGDPATHLAVGAFLAVDARGDVKQAAEHLRLAGADGHAVLAELTLAPPAGR